MLRGRSKFMPGDLSMLKASQKENQMKLLAWKNNSPTELP